MRRRVSLIVGVAALIAGMLGTAAPAAAVASVSASPGVLDFGKVQVGTTGIVYLTITNTGDQDLVWAGFSHNPPFNVDVPGSECWVVDRIQPGTSCTLTVTMAPTKPGRYVSPLQAQFNLYDDRTFVAATVDVTGQGRGCKGGGASCS